MLKQFFSTLVTLVFLINYLPAQADSPPVMGMPPDMTTIQNGPKSLTENPTPLTDAEVSANEKTLEKILAKLPDDQRELIENRLATFTPEQRNQFIAELIRNSSQQ